MRPTLRHLLLWVSRVFDVVRALFGNNEPGAWYDADDLTDAKLAYRRNLFLATDALSTQSVTVAWPATYVLSFTGTGSIVISGKAIGTLAGTGASTRVYTTVVPFEAGSITFTVSGSVTFAQFENTANDTTTGTVNDIGIAGQAGAGVGIHPSTPTGYTPMTGYSDPYSVNYGNYTGADGSAEVWVPAYYLRIGDSRNATYALYGVNSISIVKLSTYANEAAANADNYYLHRAFVNAGVNEPGFFRDKYDSSQNGTTASSIYNAMPLVSGPAAGQVGFSVCTANGQTPANAYYGAFAASKSRSAKHFPESVFIADALCRISEWIAQAATISSYCAWYSSGTTNFPKGNDNNALHSTDDSGVVFTTAGASSHANFANAGSGVPFAKTTHNGQACGISDVAGNIYKINPGLTCIATTKNITGATQANPVALTVVAHGRTTGDPVQIESVGGMTQLNGKIFACTVVDANTITLDATDGTAFGAYTSGGTCIGGTFYVLKTSVDIATVTGGATGATDHWGATGVAALFDAVTLKFNTTYPNNAFAQRYGNGANQVFAWDTSANRALAMMGMPAAGGVSPSGSNAMGLDYYYQYIRDQLCVLSRGYWSAGSYAGGRYRYLDNHRTNSSGTVGLACASYNRGSA